MGRGRRADRRIAFITVVVLVGVIAWAAAFAYQPGGAQPSLPASPALSTPLPTP